jgi:cytidylate kinase
LAEKLGVEFFDKALIKTMEEKYNLTVEEIEKLKGRRTYWWEDFAKVMRVGEPEIRQYEDKLGKEPEKLTTDNVFKAETEILEGIVEEESCVLAGRCGFFVFRNHPNHLSVLIQASMPFRLERLMRKNNMTEDEARKTIAKVDKMRENYVKKFTGTSRYDTRNYDLVIKADGKTEDEIVDIIMQVIG